MNSYNSFKQKKINYNTPQVMGNNVKSIVNTYSQLDKQIAKNNRQIQSGISNVGADYLNQKDIYNASNQNINNNANLDAINRYRSIAGLSPINLLDDTTQRYLNIDKKLTQNDNSSIINNESQGATGNTTNIWQGNQAQQSAYNTKRNQLLTQQQSIIDQLNTLGHNSNMDYEDGDYLNGWNANDYESYSEYFRLIQELNNVESTIQDLDASEQARYRSLVEQDVGREQAQKYLDTYAKMQGMGSGGYNQGIQANLYNNYLNNVANINQYGQESQQSIMNNYRQNVMQLEQQRYESNYQKAQTYYNQYQTDFNELQNEISGTLSNDSKSWTDLLDRYNKLDEAYSDMIGNFSQFDRTFNDDTIDNKKGLLNNALTFASSQEEFNNLIEKYSDIYDAFTEQEKKILDEKRTSLPNSNPITNGISYSGNGWSGTTGLNQNFTAKWNNQEYKLELGGAIVKVKDGKSEFSSQLANHDGNSFWKNNITKSQLQTWYNENQALLEQMKIGDIAEMKLPNLTCYLIKTPDGSIRAIRNQQGSTSASEFLRDLGYEDVPDSKGSIILKK